MTNTKQKNDVCNTIYPGDVVSYCFPKNGSVNEQFRAQKYLKLHKNYTVKSIQYSKIGEILFFENVPDQQNGFFSKLFLKINT